MTPRQQKALMALIRSPTVEAAAKSAGIGYSTLRRWLKDDEEFRREYQAEVSQLVEDASLQARQNLTPALSTLREIVEDSEKYPGAVRVSAARSLLEFGLRLTERADVLNRLDAMEDEENNA